MTIARLIADRDPAAIITCAADATLKEAVACLAERRIGALPVIDDTGVCGILSERDVIYRLRDEGAACLERRVAEVMTAPAITVTRATTVDEALQLMTRRRVRHLPVIENGAMVGFVSIGDLVKAQVDEAQREAALMRDYITHA
ncbi:CBS domain-containing protein [Erythrobacteraceae bacterium CFH 75059]|uniref:CBS domain-containing protein n=1 Tax=Qipengyuania thermophila TaxID=2509361 RepID=UPI00102037F7|nr:CBS domain-containing protein [Qipengyuania thermophila]TCD06681.1 CBS domain-containing protein [Erythrobacteraceae bacterium CFH 75059]